MTNPVNNSDFLLDRWKSKVIIALTTLYEAHPTPNLLFHRKPHVAVSTTVKVKKGDLILVPLTRSVTLVKTTKSDGFSLGDLYVGDDGAPVRGYLKFSNVWSNAAQGSNTVGHKQDFVVACFW